MAWQMSYDASIGTIPFVASSYSNLSIQMTAGTFREGTRSFRVRRGTLATPGYFRAPFVTPTATPTLSVWLYLHADYFDQEQDVRYMEVRFVTTSAHTVSARWNRANQTYDLYVGEDLVAGGTADVVTGPGLFNLRLYGFLNDLTGTLTLNINGVIVADYSGDTLPGGSDAEVEYVEFWGRGSASIATDLFWASCISLNDGGTDPSDRRVYVKFPTSDNSIQWSRSSGTNSWEILDNVPPTTAYVYTETNGHIDKLGLGDIGEVYAIHGVAKFIYGLKTTGGAETILNGVDSNTTIDYTENAVGTTVAHHYHRMTVDPNTLVAFTKDGINALLTYREANI